MKTREIAVAHLLVVLSIIAALTVTSFAQSNSNANTLQPPMTEKKTKTTKIHDETMIDDYFWLREKTNPEVIRHLEAENGYAEAMMKPTAALQLKLYNEMVGHIKETDRSVPYRWGGYFYYTRTEQGKQYPINCRMKGSLDAKEEVVLDQNEMAKGLKFFSIGAFVPSDDGNLLAYSTDTTGYRQYKLQFKDLRTGQVLPETFERVGSVAWATDNKTIFFTTEDAVTKRSDKFFRHVLGSDQTDLIFEEKDELFDIGAGRSRDKAVILLGSESKTSTEWRYLPANDPTAELKIISPREADH
ncbi:MAG: oligopeptidase B, partial [bacterium]